MGMLCRFQRWNVEHMLNTASFCNNSDCRTKNEDCGLSIFFLKLGWFGFIRSIKSHFHCSFRIHGFFFKSSLWWVMPFSTWQLLQKPPSGESVQYCPIVAGSAVTWGIRVGKVSKSDSLPRWIDKNPLQPLKMNGFWTPKKPPELEIRKIIWTSMTLASKYELSMALYNSWDPTWEKFQSYFGWQLGSLFWGEKHMMAVCSSKNDLGSGFFLLTWNLKNTFLERRTIWPKPPNFGVPC